MNKNPSEFPPFDFATKAQELINNQQVQQVLAQPGVKERVISYLQTGSVSSLTEADRPLIQVIVSLISTYALQSAYEQCKSNEAVRKYMSFIDRMHGGEDLQQEMINLVPKLPTEFKDGVRNASNQAQEIFIKLLKTT